MRSCVDLRWSAARVGVTERRGARSWNRLGSALAVCGMFWVTLGLSSPQGLPWEQLAEGMVVTTWDPGTRCDGRVPRLFMVKIDPERFRFSTYHFMDEGLPAPLTIQEWQERTHASVLFNAGLFREDYSYMGWLFKGGRSLGSKRHPLWKGLFVAEPVGSGVPKARVLDLALEHFSPDHPAYREAAQSLMLLDRGGKPRVRRTGNRAHQTVVAEDRAGSLVVIKTAEEVTMWELAVCLQEGLPEIAHAMAMDGGASSDLLISSDLPGVREAESPSFWQRLVDGNGMEHIALPTVIGVAARDKGRQR
ncbi:MAG: phosphodiester glycosidase family protein [Nitrospiraceae bacterium]